MVTLDSSSPEQIARFERIQLYKEALPGTDSFSALEGIRHEALLDDISRRVALVTQNRYAPSRQAVIGTIDLVKQYVEVCLQIIFVVESTPQNIALASHHELKSPNGLFEKVDQRNCELLGIPPRLYEFSASQYLWELDYSRAIEIFYQSYDGGLNSPHERKVMQAANDALERFERGEIEVPQLIESFLAGNLGALFGMRPTTLSMALSAILCSEEPLLVDYRGNGIPPFSLPSLITSYPGSDQEFSNLLEAYDLKVAALAFDQKHQILCKHILRKKLQTLSKLETKQSLTSSDEFKKVLFLEPRLLLERAVREHQEGQSHVQRAIARALVLEAISFPPFSPEDASEEVDFILQRCRKRLDTYERFVKVFANNPDLMEDRKKYVFENRYFVRALQENRRYLVNLLMEGGIKI